MPWARANGERIAVFAPGLNGLQRWSEDGLKINFEDGRPMLRYVEGGWRILRDLIEAGSSTLCAHLVMALDVADEETGRPFGLRSGDLKYGQAAVLV